MKLEGTTERVQQLCVTACLNLVLRSDNAFGHGSEKSRAFRHVAVDKVEKALGLGNCGDRNVYIVKRYGTRGRTVKLCSHFTFGISHSFSSMVSSLSACLLKQCDLRLSGSPSGQGAGDGERARDKRVPADVRTDSLSTVPPMLPDAER
ncbi:hypothetical protein PoB_006441100 [Plakobranchus ocellatus]|uniref:Uncharacterized protein n=1 Tax=Plakobranchus ocellatus TaxID=259542 RepID=A0AAV4D1P7_9GAST|nr:hypothetical protein PoB_006441100 [Plakobranchus ocellatus]